MSDELLELPEGWEWTTLDAIMKKIVDGTHHTPTYVDDGIPFLSVKDIRDGQISFDNCKYISQEEHKQLCQRCHPECGDLLITKSGTIGRCAVVKTKRDFSLFVSVALLKPATSEVKISFISLAFQVWFQSINVQNDITGTAIKNFHLVDFRKLPIPFPPLNEQKRIVAKIEELSDRSQTAQKALETIPQLCDRFRQSVLAAAFRGDLTADWREKNPHVEPASQLLLKIIENRQQKYNEECEELLLQNKKPPKLANFEVVNINFDIPEHWITISVESACLFIIDCLHNTPKFIEQGEYCIDTTCIEPFKINWDRARKVTSEDFLIRTSRMNPKHNDILFSREGTIGTSVKVPISPKLCLGQRMMMFRFSPLILPEYAELYLQSPIFKQQYKPFILGSTSPHLNIGDIRKLGFIAPPLEEQKQIVYLIQKYFKIIETIEKQHKQATEKLEKLNQSILSKAFRGELVPQDPEDEPASVLLERIRAEREKLNNSKPKSTSKRKSKTPKEQATIPGLE